MVATDEIEAVMRLGEISPVPGTPPYVAGLAALRSRVLTVIDVAALITGSCGIIVNGEGNAHHAIICEADGHSYALLVDGVEDILTISGEIPSTDPPIDGRWRPYVQGGMEKDGQYYLLLSVADVLAPMSGQALT